MVGSQPVEISMVMRLSVLRAAVNQLVRWAYGIVFGPRKSAAAKQHPRAIKTIHLPRAGKK
jgi:hypothetical protein